ncbi:hypothetical protein AARAC_009786 [Aspergillus arachidicola]|uniref:BD-FAE-like domain-containing protein n=1 Tax=Aspergillus arachidicola TaxID=656916 RepID=A0A2G7FNS4_9EURO|nr:hypothetical protein AARAC_009786 [Aspergillus arachidicola]
MATNTDVDQSTISEPNPIAIAARGKEITGLGILQTTSEKITAARIEKLISAINADRPTGGTDMAYGNKDTQHLRFWNGISSKAPIIVFVHGGSWQSGTNLDSIGSAKVDHLTRLGYAFATISYTLIPVVTVEEQVQEVADSLGYLVKNAASLGFDPERVILMGRSSGAHVVTLLGTDLSYVERAAEITDSPGPVADNLTYGLGTDPERLYAMSPTYHAQAPNADAFLLLHVHRQGDIRQAVELVAGPPPTRSGFGL